MNIVLFNNKNKDSETVNLLFDFSSMENFAANEDSISGVAVPYGQKTGDWRKISFAKGAFKKIKSVPLFLNHQSHDVLKMIGSVSFEESPKALRFDAKLNMEDDDVTKKVLPLVKMKALEGVSIGAHILKKDVKTDKDGDILEIIVTEAEIYELSVVTRQAFENAKIEASKLKENQMSKKTVDLNAVELGAEPIVEPSVEPRIEAEAEPTQEPIVKPAAEATMEPTIEASADPIIEPSIGPVELSEVELLRAENIELKEKSTSDSKARQIEDLMCSGVVHKSQKEKIMKQFSTADQIKEFYKDVPASYSVEPKGEDHVDVTSAQVESEVAEKLSKQLSGISAEDIIKYSKK